ncbi:glycoside hydrolase family 3 C-terminal domain-containing protein [Aureibaculum sp. A20]|uniref:Glycoside hydrolase family 3 C-terminal domain-containing protein n=1 Tax=Aureibaculum flavum TaxID=2795986 RepID=A0ABS0WNM4_9FLAO|nr:glycoside hydrolase family 3 C-terminal domain-containing protein [Aureibaculum flavum]MBJ2173559.1 glycoside hydrolase family 3 C-terminal domain-containing protein [Aureibaculum flavum]
MNTFIIQRHKVIHSIIALCFLLSYSLTNAQQSSSIHSKNTEVKIDSIISLLTLEEKVSLVHAQSKFSTPGIPRLGIPEIWMSDGPHGVRGEINWDNWGYADWTNDSITAFPALTCLAATFNPSLSNDYGISVGEEARYRKKDILLGPGVNIYRTPLNGRNFEYMGEDPFLASKMVVPYIKGVQQNGVSACVKHYVLNNQEEWRDHINVKVSERALHEIYLPAFKAAIMEGGAWSLMGSYNKHNGQYCSHHDKLINTILKGDWGFDGVVITDWGSAHDTKEAILNGLDIEMGTGTDGLTTNQKNAYDNYYLAYPFLQLLKSGEIDEKYVDDKVRRILRLMYRTTMSSNRPMGRMNNVEHHEVARKVASEGIVLLKNENNFFPIKDDKNITIAVIGENATRSMTIGGGSSELKAQFEISPLEGLKKIYKNATIIHAMGYASGPSAYAKVLPSTLDAEKLKTEAIATAQKADIVLFVGGLNKNHHQDCEGGDRLKFGLPFGQEDLIDELLKVNKNMGVILVSGNAVEMPWLEQVNGLMQSWYLGSMAGQAIADVVIGNVNPSGKLPFSFPKKLKDNAAHFYGDISYPGDSINQEYKEGILVGYRWHDTKKIKPLFPFGFGLSYSSFDLTDITTDKKSYTPKSQIKVTCTVSNTGTKDGAEVVQVYVGKSKSKVQRAFKELKGFNKVNLNAGEQKTIEILINTDDLSFYNESTANWQLETGNYYIYVGNASDHITKKIKFTIN